MGIKKSTENGLLGDFEYDGELKYRLIFEKSPIGIFQYNTDAVITECNDRFMEILQSKRELLLELNMHRYIGSSVHTCMSLRVRMVFTRDFTMPQPAEQAYL